MLTTTHKGRLNIITYHDHVLAHDGREADYRFAALRKTGECVIAIPAVELAPKAVKVGNTTGRDIDKFAAFGLTPVPAKRVGAHLSPNASPISNAR
jgi:hypothetical protein